MKLKSFIEEYENTAKTFGKRARAAEIFSNPTKKELRDVLKNQVELAKYFQDKTTQNEVRFIIDFDKKKIYVFPGDLLHVAAAEKLGFKYKGMTVADGRVFGYGRVDIKTGKITIDRFSKKEINMEDNKWLDRYLK